MELSDEECVEEKGEEKSTNKNIKDDSKVNKKKNIRVQWIPCRIWKLQKQIIANALLEKGARNTFKTVKNFWNERS